MSEQWDEFSKSLSEPVPRRESLRRLGAVFAGALLGSVGLKTAWAAPRTDPCKAFCRCSNKWEQNACLEACRNCNKDPSRLCGSCWSGYACTDLANDVRHCGACFHNCWSEARANEQSACLDGECVYDCVAGAVDCDGTCSYLGWDPANCGTCGNLCGGSTPYCNQGTCTACPPGQTLCTGSCVDLAFDGANCGACGNVCDEWTPVCNQGTCIACQEGLTDCGGFCTDLQWDEYNCGACGYSCWPAGCQNGSCGQEG